MLRTIVHFHNLGLKTLEEGMDLEEILALKVRERISKMKFMPEEEAELLEVFLEIDRVFKELHKAKE
jgi:V/A-type H+-transporting ATPase subunit A